MERDKKDIVRELLKKGILITPEELEKMNEGEMQKFLSRETKPTTTKEEKETTVKIRSIVEKDKLSPEDFVRYYSNKYESIKNMLLKRVNAVSIINTKKNPQEVSIIGMVRETTPQGFLIEDQTGEIDVIVKKDNVLETEDVAAFNGFSREGKFFAKEIILPDIPLTRDIKKTDVTLVLTKELTEKVKNIQSDFVFIPKTDVKSEKIITNLPNPTQTEVQKNNIKTNILIYMGKDKVSKEHAINFLKKRHLSPKIKQIRSSDDYFLIDPVPDVFWLIQEDNWSENYKGVKIVSSASVKINLETGETFFL